MNNKDQWPYFQSDYFHSQSELVRNFTKITNQVIIPFVAEHEKDAWENYTLNNPEWVSHEVTSMNASNTYSPTMFTLTNMTHSDIGPAKYAPLWQSSPYLKDTINLDLLSTPGAFNAYKTLWETNAETILGSVIFPPGQIEPLVEYFHPIYSRFFKMDEIPNRDDMVAMLSSLMPLKSLFSNPFSTSFQYEILVVTRDALGEDYSFLFDGRDVSIRT